MLNFLKEYKAIVEKQSGYNIRNLRSNQGGEYASNDSKVCVNNIALDNTNLNI